MEVAHSTPFLTSTILFSSTSDFDKALKSELWACHEHMKISITELNNMPVLDRKNYIILHNKSMEKQKQEMDKMMKRGKHK